MNTKIALISALAPVSIALAFTFASPAKAAGQLADACHANSAGQTIACCKTWVKQNGMPIWMDHAGMSCTDIASCVRGGGRREAATLSVAPNRRCYIKVVVLQDTSGGNGSPPPPSKGRGR